MPSVLPESQAIYPGALTDLLYTICQVELSMTTVYTPEKPGEKPPDGYYWGIEDSKWVLCPNPEEPKPSKQFIAKLRRPHARQQPFIDSKAKRKIIRAGRRSGKTVGIAIMHIQKFLAGRRQLYTAPTIEQVDRFWFEVCRSLGEPIAAGVYHKNETEHVIERVGTENRIKAKTAWNANTMRGDYADDLTFDEWQLMDEDAWEVVGAPMLLDNGGNAVFIYTPPSLRSAGVSKARDPRHAAKMYKAAIEDKSGRWEAFHFTSHENPYISEAALSELILDMSKQSYRQEILAEDDELAVTQLVYGKFNEAVCKIPRFEIPKEWPRYSGHDFGGANPAALFFAQVKLPLPDGAPPYMRFGDFVAYREYLPGPGFSIPQHVEQFRRIADGNGIQSAGGSHNEDEIRQGYTAHKWPILDPKFHNVLPQVDRVIGLMELNKLFIFNDLYHYLEEIMNCLWKRDNQGIITNDIQDEQRFHLCACARYRLSDFTPETVDSNRPVSRRSNRF